MTKYTSGVTSGVLTLISAILFAWVLLMPTVKPAEPGFVYWIAWAMLPIMVFIGALQLYRTVTGKAD